MTSTSIDVSWIFFLLNDECLCRETNISWFGTRLSNSILPLTSVTTRSQQLTVCLSVSAAATAKPQPQGESLWKQQREGDIWTRQKLYPPLVYVSFALLDATNSQFITCSFFISHRSSLVTFHVCSFNPLCWYFRPFSSLLAFLLFPSPYILLHDFASCRPNTDSRCSAAKLQLPTTYFYLCSAANI